MTRINDLFRLEIVKPVKGLIIKTLQSKFGILILVFSFCTLNAFAQENILIEISGQVLESEKKVPLSDVSVQIKGTVTGTITNSTGKFVLRTKT